MIHTLSTYPQYGITQRQPENQNIIQKAHFRFNCLRIPNVTYFAQKAIIPSMELNVVQQSTNFNPIALSGGKITQAPFILTFLIDEEWSTWTEMRKWVEQCSNYDSFSEYQKVAEHQNDDATLLLLVNENQPNLKVTFQGLFPTRLGAIELDTRSPIAEFLVCSAHFTYTTFNITSLRTGS